MASDPQMTGRDCRTCGWRREPKTGSLSEHYQVCGWTPDAWPSNALHLVGSGLAAYEHDRLLPRKVLAEMPELLRPCPTWRKAQ